MLRKARYNGLCAIAFFCSLNSSSFSMKLHFPRIPQKFFDFLGVLYITTFIFTIIYAPQPLFAAIHAAFPVGEATISLLISVIMLSLGVAPLLYGALLSSISTCRLLQISMFLLAITGLPIFFAHSFPMMLVARLGQGLLVPAVLTSLMAHISSRFQGAELQRAMATYIGTTILGGLFGRIISAVLATWFGWRWAMLLIALAILPGIFIVMGFSGETRPRFTKTHWASFRQVFKNTILLRLLFFEAGGSFVFLAIGNSLPFYLHSLSGEISELRVAFMYSGYALGAFIAFSSGRLVRLFGGEARTLLLTFCAYFALMPGFTSTNIHVIFLVMTLFCVTQFMQHSICPGLINRLSESERGVTNGIYLSCYYTGGALGSYLSVLVYVHCSWFACVAMLMTLVFAMLCVALSLRKKLSHV